MAIATYYHVDPTSSGDAGGSTWANAMGLAEWETHLEATVVAGDIYFLRDGTYTMTSTIDSNARDGSSTAPIGIIGVAAGTTNEGSSVVYSDWSIATADKPFVDVAANQFITGSYYFIIGVSFQGSVNGAVAMGTFSHTRYCIFDNDVGSPTTASSLFYDTASSSYCCEFLGTNGTGVDCDFNSQLRFIHCYFHDMTGTNGKGLNDLGNGAVVDSCIFDTLAVGLDQGNVDNLYLKNCSFYEVDICVDATDGNASIYINNVLEGSDTSGFDWTTQVDMNFFYGNHGDDTRNTDMWVLVESSTLWKDQFVTTGDPVFTDAAGGDFSLNTSTSPLIDAGQGMELGVG